MRAGIQLVPLMPMPGWLTEGPIHAMQSASDWRFRTDGVFNTGSNNPPGVFNGPAGIPASWPRPYQAPKKPWFDTFAWRPSGDGTQPMYPTEADLAKIYGYWPIFDNKPSGLGQPGDAGDGNDGWRLFLQATSTVAIVTLAALGIGAYLKDRKRGR